MGAEMWFVVERQFTYAEERLPDGIWRQIGEFTGPDSRQDAEAYVQNEVATYRSPARYRILQVTTVATVEREPGGGQAITPRD